MDAYFQKKIFEFDCSFSTQKTKYGVESKKTKGKIELHYKEKGNNVESIIKSRTKNTCLSYPLTDNIAKIYNSQIESGACAVEFINEKTLLMINRTEPKSLKIFLNLVVKLKDKNNISEQIKNEIKSNSKESEQSKSETYRVESDSVNLRKIYCGEFSRSVFHNNIVKSLTITDTNSTCLFLLPKMKNLIILSISNNKTLNWISDDFFLNLNNLESVDLSGNLLSFLPNSLGTLTKLKYLNLCKNKLKDIPSSIGNLTNLLSLNLSENNLTSVPLSIKKLILNTLDLSYNSLNHSPKTKAFKNKPSSLFHACVSAVLFSNFCQNQVVTIPPLLLQKYFYTLNQCSLCGKVFNRFAKVMTAEINIRSICRELHTSQTDSYLSFSILGVDRICTSCNSDNISSSNS
ncbi:hypothetical protein HZS_2208 [Henneguya salminicola]|nr:hypothetical protein HZS_2208 [Henneguya salminicola]